MNATRRLASIAILAGLSLFFVNAIPVVAQDAAAGGGAAAPKYTMAEYNAYQAAAAEKNPAAQLKLLDDFVAKYPNSTLLSYIYPIYYANYWGAKNFQKTIEYADKQLALTTINPTERYQAYSIRATAFNNIKDPDVASAKAAHDAAIAGVKSVDAVPKPDGVDDAKFAEQKRTSVIFFNGTAANAAMLAKDYPSAIESYKAVLTATPDDLASNYSIGKAYLAMNPPQQLDGMWFFARAASAKTATDAQSKSMKSYLRSLISKYQGGTVCDALTDAELSELLQLASSSVDRPASYKPFSAADLEGARKDMTIASVVTDLKAGGDKAKLTWTASCGLEFPDVPGKIIEITPGDTVDLKLAFVTSDAEFQAATVANMDVQVAGQPEAGKLEKDNPARFTGTLESYDPDPAFMLHWDKAKVNAEDLPKEKAAPKKPVHKAAPKS